VISIEIQRRAGSGYRNGGFLGFDSENSSDECSDVERGGDRANVSFSQSLNMIIDC